MRIGKCKFCNGELFKTTGALTCEVIFQCKKCRIYAGSLKTMKKTK